MEKIFIAVISGSFCAMLTAILSLVFAPRILRTIAIELLNQHVAVYHQDNMYRYVEGKFKEHNEHCRATQGIHNIEFAVIWLVEKNGGNPKELGLIK